MKPQLFGKSIIDIEQIVSDLKGKSVHVLDIIKGLYKSNISSFDELKTIPKSFLRLLDSKYSVGKYKPLMSTLSVDSSIKYLFENQANQKFESIYMPSLKRHSLCISTQSGCRMGCDFCRTSKIGFHGNLIVRDILNQFYSIPDWKKINRIVIMGMGEPFDNFDEIQKAVTILTANWGLAFGASNITISTVGLKDQLIRFLQNPFCNLAISLHSPFSEERYRLMPIEKSNPISEVVELIRENPIVKPLRLSFEYVALGGINTSKEHSKAIGDLLKGLSYHLNIISLNEYEGCKYISPGEIELKSFISCLTKNGIRTTIRESRGMDIGAACGQMAGE